MTEKNDKKEPETKEPMMMLLLRALAIGVICYFIYRFIEPLLH